LLAGVGATAINIGMGLVHRDLRRSYLVAAALAVVFAFYLVRGAVLLEFYIVPLLPFLALNIALAVHALTRVLPRVLALGVLLGVALGLGIYFTQVEHSGRDAFGVQQTGLQAGQLAYVRAHIPPSAIIMTDDDLWVDLHDGAGGLYPVYLHADSHWKVAGDPAVRDNPHGINRNWRNIDYVVASNKMLDILKSDGNDRYHVALNAYLHSVPVWSSHVGQVTVEVRKVVR
jgi:hypothetical protein